MRDAKAVVACSTHARAIGKSEDRVAKRANKLTGLEGAGCNKAAAFAIGGRGCDAGTWRDGHDWGFPGSRERIGVSWRMRLALCSGRDLQVANELQRIKILNIRMKKKTAKVRGECSANVYRTCGSEL